MSEVSLGGFFNLSAAPSIAVQGKWATMAKLFQERSQARAVRALRVANRPTETGPNRSTQQVADVFGSPITQLTLIDDVSRWTGTGTGMVLHCVPREHGFCLPVPLDQYAHPTGMARQAAKPLERRAHIGAIAA